MLLLVSGSTSVSLLEAVTSSITGELVEVLQVPVHLHLLGGVEALREDQLTTAPVSAGTTHLPALRTLDPAEVVVLLGSGVLGLRSHHVVLLPVVLRLLLQASV